MLFNHEGCGQDFLHEPCPMRSAMIFPPEPVMNMRQLSGAMPTSASIRCRKSSRVSI